MEGGKRGEAFPFLFVCPIIFIWGRRNDGPSAASAGSFVVFLFDFAIDGERTIGGRLFIFYLIRK